MSLFISQRNGLIFENDKIKIFFGNRYYSNQDLVPDPDHIIHSLKQIHSDLFFSIDRPNATDPYREGDALGTDLSKQYLLVKTADCLPILINDPLSSRVAAVHAGWKGIAINIVPKVISKYFSNSKTLELYIGPHIMKSSFEVRADVLGQILNSIDRSLHKQLNIVKTVFDGDDRFNIDLLDVLKTQLSFTYPQIIFNYHNANIDTKTNLDYYSFRRVPASTGRNLSYIVLK